MQIGGADEAAERQRGARPPRALAERREFHVLGEAARVVRAVDHRRDDRRRAGVDEAAGEREIADGYARDRRLAGERDGEDRLRRADEIDAAVLHVERHRVEGFARQRLGDRGVVDADPGAESTSRRSAKAASQFADHAALAHGRFLSQGRALADRRARASMAPRSAAQMNHVT